jgi:N-acyl-phosphatidylethanolamine-hydrolysing phospholipase D
VNAWRKRVAFAACTLAAAASTRVREPGEQAAGRPYHHRADGRFRNPPGSPRREASRADFASFLARRFRDRSVPAVPEDHVLSPERALAGLAAHDGADSVTWLGHAAFLIRLGGRTILTDPYLGGVAGPFGFGPRRYVEPPLPVGALPPIDVLAVSHSHYDHLDAATIRALPRRERIEVVAPLRLGDFFRRRGFRNVHELDWWERRRFGALEAALLPAVHFSRRGPFDLNRTLWGGFGFAADGVRVYFSGDTAYGETFAEIGAREGPFDLALVGIGAYEPRPIMRASHATPEEAVRIGRDVGARALLGMHWGTVALTDEPAFEPPERFRAAAAAAGFAREDAWLLRIGETRALPRGWPANR